MRIVIPAYQTQTIERPRRQLQRRLINTSLRLCVVCVCVCEYAHIYVMCVGVCVCAGYRLPFVN